MATHACLHLAQIQPVKPTSKGLRGVPGNRRPVGTAPALALTCGHVGCCDSSKNKHATKHFHTTGHPVIKTAEPGENWAWCYVEEIMFDSV